MEGLCSAPGTQWVPSGPKLLFLIGLTELRGSYTDTPEHRRGCAGEETNTTA